MPDRFTQNLISKVDAASQTAADAVSVSDSGITEVGKVTKNAVVSGFVFLGFTPSEVVFDLVEIKVAEGEWQSGDSQVNATAELLAIGAGVFAFTVTKASKDTSIDFEARVHWSAIGTTDTNADIVYQLGAADEWNYALPTARTTTRTYTPTSWLTTALNARGLQNPRNFRMGETTGFTLNATNGTITGDRIGTDIGSLPMRLHIRLDADVTGSSPTETRACYFYIDIDYSDTEDKTLDFPYASGVSSELRLTETTEFAGCVIKGITLSATNSVQYLGDDVLRYDGDSNPTDFTMNVSMTCYGVDIDANVDVTMSAYPIADSSPIHYYIEWTPVEGVTSSRTLTEIAASFGYTLLGFREWRRNSQPNSNFTWDATTLTLTYDGVGDDVSSGITARIQALKDGTYYRYVDLRLYLSKEYQYVTNWNADTHTQAAIVSNFYGKVVLGEFPIDGGSGYSKASPPTVSLDVPGSGFSTTVTIGSDGRFPSSIPTIPSADRGTGYESPYGMYEVVVTGAGTPTTPADLNVTSISNGGIRNIGVSDRGAGYTADADATLTVRARDNGFAGTAIVNDDGEVVAVDITNTGGPVTDPYAPVEYAYDVVFTDSGGSGTGASGKASAAVSGNNLAVKWVRIGDTVDLRLVSKYAIFTNFAPSPDLSGGWEVRGGNIYRGVVVASGGL